MRIYLLILSCLFISLTARGAADNAPQPQNPNGLPNTAVQKPEALPNPTAQKPEALPNTAAQKEEIAVAAPVQPEAEILPSAPAGRVVKLNPRIRATSLSVTPSIPYEIIRPFLSGTRIVNKGAATNTPYVVGGRDHSVLFASDEEILVKWLRRPGLRNYSVFRIGHPYVNPKNKELLGYEALDLGYGSIVQWGDPSVVKLYDTNQEVVVGDRLLPQDNSNLRTKYVLHRPGFRVESSILAVLGGISLVGQYSVVVIVGGIRDGLVVGDQLGIYTNHLPFEDPLDPKCKSIIYPPKELAGELLVFRTFDKLSLGVVLKAHKTIEIADNVSNL
jgi:hypothetical protein